LTAVEYVERALEIAQRFIRESVLMSDETIANAAIQDMAEIRNNLEAARDRLRPLEVVK
jgi:hypothetical protein